MDSLLERIRNDLKLNAYMFPDGISLFLRIAEVCDYYIHLNRNFSKENDNKKQARRLWEECYIRRYDLKDLIAFLQQVRERSDGQDKDDSLHTLLAQALGKAFHHYNNSYARIALLRASGPKQIPQDLRQEVIGFLQANNTKGDYEHITTLHRLEDHTGLVNSVTALTRNRVASASDDGTVRIWDLNQTNPSANPTILKGHEKDVTSVTALPDNRVASASGDGTVRIWDLNQTNPSAHSTILRHTREVQSVTMLSGNLVASAGYDNTVQIWDLNQANPSAPSIILPHTAPVTSVTALPDNRVASSSADGTVRIWDLNKANRSADPIILEGHNSWVTSVTALGRNRVASSSGDASWDASGDNTVRIWDLYKANRSADPIILEGHTGPVTSVTALPDNRVASSSADGTVRIWNLNEAKPSAHHIILHGHGGVVMSITALPDNRMASASGDTTVRIWGYISY